MFDSKKIMAVNDTNIRNIEEVANIEASIQTQDAWTDQTIKDMLKQDGVGLLTVVTQALKDKQRVVGYCLYQVLFEQAEILRIGTHPHYQRQGIASKIFSELNRALKSKGVLSLLLEVRADNAPALALYEQQGFIVIHRRQNYYQFAHQPPVDALVMQLCYKEK